jgi:hypothetical protein
MLGADCQLQINILAIMAIIDAELGILSVFSRKSLRRESVGLLDTLGMG